MSSPVFLPSVLRAADEAARGEAIDPRRSFTVRAPAGSGKTELLIQRYLALLATAERPEAIVAITFTKKAAAEMRGRILKALREAKAGAAAKKGHEELTQRLAAAALARNEDRGWGLLDHPGRMRVQTIDSLCMSIAAEMPWLSRLGAMPSIEEDTRPLYEEAARRTLLTTLPEFGPHVDALLEHLDNNAASAQTLIAQMLARRDQWMDWALQSEDEERVSLEEALARTIESRLDAAAQMIPHRLHETWLMLARFTASNMEKPRAEVIDITEWPTARAEDIEIWQALLEVVLTKSGGWRKRLDKGCGFPAGSNAKKEECARLIEDLQANADLLDALKVLGALPPPYYSDEQWSVLRALLKTLRLAVAELWVVFREHRAIDFCELGLAARRALGEEGNPSGLAYRLDSRIEHLLIDEFQDTSRGQFELARQLTADWQDGDGRTLFVVGDPMQSIYRFRQAEVGLFVHLEKNGLGGLHPKPLQLALNHRSVPSIVNRVNDFFAAAFPFTEEIETGAIAYSASEASLSETTQETSPAGDPQLSLFNLDAPTGVTFDIFLNESRDDSSGDDRARTAAQEARRLIERIHTARVADPTGSIAILVRARTHLPKIIAALKTEGLAYNAVDIDLLHERAIVRDLLALTRAMLHPADRISWLTILRAPWCGLTLADLEALVYEKREAVELHGVASGTTQNTAQHHRLTIWECLQELSGLSFDGRARAEQARDVLAEAFAEQGRWPLRRWVERAWIKLGGAAVIAAGVMGNAVQAREHAAAYFDLLEAAQSGCDLADLDQFEARVAEMMASPTAGAGAEAGAGALHVMTIHKAKGLQFDTVIVPGMGNMAKADDEPLVLFHEWMEGNKTERLIAPISGRGGDKDPFYDYLKKIEKRKGDFERVRQVYVAMTRATKRLHLMGAVLANKKGERAPKRGSMLADLWPGLMETERIIVEPDQTASSTTGSRAVLRRLTFPVTLPALPEPVQWPHWARQEEPHEPSFEWVGETLRHAGTVVHAFLQRVAHDKGDPQMPAPREVRAALKHAGVFIDDLEEAAQRVERALRSTFESERGSWILSPEHHEARTEYAVAANVGDEIVQGSVDRTFIDANGVRWIVDFKTSSHEGSGLKRFLDEQQRRYRDQMERYARILQPLGNPVRVGLYFPLLDEWREWTPALELIKKAEN